MAVPVALVSLLAMGCSTPLLPDPAVRYIAFGDSTTAGPAGLQYWQYVQQDLGASEEAFAGQGKGGETVAEGLPRLRDLLDRNVYPNAQALLFWEGGDDILKFVVAHDPLVVLSPDDPNYPFRADLNSALEQVQADVAQAIMLGKQQNLAVYVATYFDLLPGECKPALLNLLTPQQAQIANQYVNLLNDRIRQAVTDQGAVLVDVASQSAEITSTAENYLNCNHLSNQGNRVVAELFTQTIQASTR